MDPDSKRLRVSVTDGEGRPVRDGGLSRWLTSVATPRMTGDVNIALVSDARIRTLNRQYRKKDAATDVLSFPSTDNPNAERRVPNADPGFLGDIVIATGVAKAQAKDAGHSVQIELRVLALHGLLHLLGYDHHAKDDNGRMARAEARLRRRGGLVSAGLIERASARQPGARARA